MANSITPLANLTLSGAQASVTFSSISGSYRDLMLVCNPIGSVTNNYLQVRLNSDSGSNYNFIWTYGDGSSSGSYTYTNQTFDYLSNVAMDTTLGSVSITQFLDYSATDKHKSFLTRMNRASTQVGMFAHRWASTSAITSINLFTNTGSFAAGSSFALYGVSA